MPKDNLADRLKLVIKSGKVSIGIKSTLKRLRDGKAKMVVVSSNLSALRRSELEYYCMLAKTEIIHSPENNINLGAQLGKIFRIGAFAIVDSGNVDLSELIEA
jgi:large subunit ribosomal protein L30e